MGLSGVVISIVLYLLADRKTIGAKREKINSIYEEVIKTLFRSIIHESYIPSIEEIERMITTKCIKNKLKLNYFPEPLEFVNAVYTKIMQDDVLEGKKKKSLINKVNEYIEINSKKVSDEIEDETVDTGKEDKFRLLLMVMSSVMAVLFTFFITINKTNLFPRETIYLLIGTFVAALTSIMMLTFIKRYKEDNTISSQIQNKYRNYKELENKISRMIKNFESVVEPRIITSKGRARVDFQFKKGNKKYFVEIKSFSSSAPRSSIYQLMRVGRILKLENKNNITILVTNNKRAISLYYNDLNTAWDHIFDETEFKIFRNKLVHSS